MRLLTKTTLYFFAAMVLLLVLAGFYLFGQFSRQINERSDRELVAEEQAWIDYLETGLENGRVFILKTREVSVYPVNAPANGAPLLENITEKLQLPESSFPFRQLSQTVQIGDLSYQIVLRKSQEQKAILLANFKRIMLLFLAGLFIVVLVFNWVISRNLWAPFRQSLQKIRDTELNKIQTLQFGETNTVEFNELNNSLNALRDKIYRDYINMKEFTENAAHEMQTPIAAVQGKMELLLQDQHLQEEQVQLIADATGILTRLARLNQGLLLLAKIENNQYEAAKPASFINITEKYLRLFDDMINAKSLSVETVIEEDFCPALHPLLADSLVTNLLGNAVKYNYPGGKIRITVSKNKYQVSNTSQLDPIPREKLFKRFNTSKEQDESSNGLGLAIAKKIADTNSLRLGYFTENRTHFFVLEMTS
jgi:signal transduction histidine kinase